MGQYIRLRTHSLGDILPIIARCWESGVKRSLIPSGYIVGVSSTRLKLFSQASKSKHGIRCKACGISASHFAVEMFSGSKMPSTHLNLYGTDGDKEILFTKDHKVAAANGGSDSLNNMQVMCQPCNSKKGTKNNFKFLNSIKSKNEYKTPRPCSRMQSMLI